jgi:SH3-like domain-containing protein
MRLAAASLLFVLASPAWALDFASTQRPAILYDAPSTAADKVAVISADYPLEKLVTTEGWIKVRDATGGLAWIEASALGTKRTLLVTATTASVMAKPSEGSQLRFRAARSIALEMVMPPEGGWVMVRHAGGTEGYVRIGDVWGL